MQIVSKNGKVFCQTTIDYSPATVKQMKSAGYKVKEVIADAKSNTRVSKPKPLI